ncbi:hypothetical protein GMA75_05215 [Turicibacter sanguinis]|uniref:hypothetical protein n=1 Tax=uncultured Turicibacter sp. TaxID=297316 RepID=UPI0012BB8F58|nr:hypothetical protein [uncultured Turicibacter sp.]MTK72091.1 hypothetical protein [Turicibacter sanguinis]
MKKKLFSLSLIMVGMVSAMSMRDGIPGAHGWETTPDIRDGWETTPDIREYGWETTPDIRDGWETTPDIK